MKRQAKITIHNKRAIQKRLRVANRYRESTKLRNTLLSNSPKYKKKTKITYLTLHAPEEICIYTRSSHQKLITFIKQVRKVTLSNNQKVRIDFSNTQKCGASGMILFLSEIDRIYRISNNDRVVTGHNLNNETLRQVFKQTGLGKLLYISDDIAITDDTVKHWKYITGEGTESSLVGELADELRPQLGDDVASEIFGAYVDAIDNVAGHAYVEPRSSNDKFTEKRWWMFAEIQDGRFISSTCDLGIGVSRSLPAEGFHEELLEHFKKIGVHRNDSTMIKAAFDLNRTKTKNKKHGKGLKKMRKIVDIIGQGHISIYSNAGLYTYSISDNGKVKESLHTTKNIMGTIVEWNLPIDLLKSSITQLSEES